MIGVKLLGKVTTFKVAATITNMDAMIIFFFVNIVDVGF